MTGDALAGADNMYRRQSLGDIDSGAVSLLARRRFLGNGDAGAIPFLAGCSAGLGLITEDDGPIDQE